MCINNAHILCKQIIQKPTCLKDQIKGKYKEQVFSFYAPVNCLARFPEYAHSS